MATPRTVAIDGPAGAGKSTIGALVAERLGYLFLDTGAMYRAIALAALRRGIDPDDGPRLTQVGREIRIAIGPPTVRDGRAYTVLLDGADVTWAIRDPSVDRIVSQAARVPYVRDVLVEQQREIASRGRIVMVGRDIGTVVLPDAERRVHPRLESHQLEGPTLDRVRARPCHSLHGEERALRDTRHGLRPSCDRRVSGAARSGGPRRLADGPPRPRSGSAGRVLSRGT